MTATPVGLRCLLCAQRGVDLPSLDVTYFTSLSYYILLLFGLRGVFMLSFRENTIDETQMYRQQMGMGGGGNPMAAMTSADPTKALEAERAALEMVRPMQTHSGVNFKQCIGTVTFEGSGCKGAHAHVFNKRESDMPARSALQKGEVDMHLIGATIRILCCHRCSLAVTCADLVMPRLVQD